MNHAVRSSYPSHPVAAEPALAADQARASRDGFVLFAHPKTACAAVLLAALVLGSLSAWTLDVPVAIGAAALPQGIRTLAGWVTLLGLSNYMLLTAAALVLIAVLVLRREVSGASRRTALRLRERAVFFFVAIAGSGIAVQVVKHVVGRARPKALDTLGAFHFDFFSVKASLASLPSGHATSVFAAATALAVMLPRWRITLFAAACLIAASRAAVGAHYVSDVIAGAALGVLFTTGLAAVFATKGWTFRWHGESLVLRESQAQDKGLEPSA